MEVKVVILSLPYRPYFVKFTQRALDNTCSHTTCLLNPWPDKLITKYYSVTHKAEYG